MLDQINKLLDTLGKDIDGKIKPFWVIISPVGPFHNHFIGDCLFERLTCDCITWYTLDPPPTILLQRFKEKKA